MGTLSMDGKHGKPIESTGEMLGRFLGELHDSLPGWLSRLTEQPNELEEIEREVHQLFARGADMVVAGLVALVMGRKKLAEAAEAIRQSYSQPLGKGRERSIQIRLMGGLLVWVRSLYCAPRKRLFRNSDQSRSGIYTEWIQFGGGKGVSPGLQSRVARAAALSPSLETARQELAREGLDLDYKTFRRITYDCGEGMLWVRKSQLEEFREGRLAQGTELAGQRVSVQFDGGRVKLRGAMRSASQQAKQAVDEDGLPVDDAPARSKKKPKKTYQTDWREPKLMRSLSMMSMAR